MSTLDMKNLSEGKHNNIIPLFSIRCLSYKTQKEYNYRKITFCYKLDCQFGDRKNIYTCFTPTILSLENYIKKYLSFIGLNPDESSFELEKEKYDFRIFFKLQIRLPFLFRRE